MIVIRHWPLLPRETEVQWAIDALQEWCATFLLRTPISIMPANLHRGPHKLPGRSNGASLAEGGWESYC